MEPLAESFPKPDAKVEPGRYGSMFPQTPANGFTLIANVKPGCAEKVREYGRRLQEAVQKDPHVLAPLRLHYLRWALIDNDTRFVYIGIFDTDFDKYVEDAVMLFNQTGLATIFEQLEDFPEDWRTNPGAFAKYAREHQCQSFMEYAEYPGVTATEVVKALEIKHSFSDMLDRMQ